LSTKRKQPIVHPRRTQPEPPIIRPVAIFIALVVLCSIYIVVRGFYESNPALTIIVIITTIGIIVGFTLLLVKVVGNLITREFRKEDVQLKQQAAERSQHAKQREEERQRKETELRKRREEERERQAEEERIRQELLQRQETALEFMRGLDGRDFERFLADFFRKQGYEVLETKASGDQGADLLLYKDHDRIAVQVKQWEGSVGNKAVHEAHAGRAFYNTYAAWVIATSAFTQHAVEAARYMGVRLINGAELADWVSDDSRNGS
jgi:restriction endonuclease Mrr